VRVLLTKDQIEEILERHPWLPRPKYIYILNAPIVYPQLRALVHGMNPVPERDVVILGSTATEETLIHEIIHVAGLGEIAAYSLAPKLLRFRKVLPGLMRRRPRYEQRIITSSELRRFGLTAIGRIDHTYIPVDLEVVELRRVD
jgi:hypothetical protein